jgi:hypothetical protein
MWRRESLDTAFSEGGHRTATLVFILIIWNREEFQLFESQRIINI